MGKEDDARWKWRFASQLLGVATVCVSSSSSAVAQVPQSALPRLTAAEAVLLGKLLASTAGNQALLYDPITRSGSGQELVRHALEYARAVHSGELKVEDFDPAWGLHPQSFDPLPSLIEALRRDKLREWFNSLPPPYQGYDNLLRGLQGYLRIFLAGGWPTLDVEKELAAGAEGDRVSQLRARLSVEDRRVAPVGDSFDDDLQAAVRRAQLRYGLPQTGVATSETIKALNVPAGDRINQIRANLERWRWLPSEFPPNRVQININAGVLTVFEDDAPVTSMRVAGGNRAHPTPMLASTITAAVISPSWQAPEDVARQYLTPQEASSPGFFKREGYYRARDGHVYQKPGARNSLGQYKFEFSSPYSIYIQDTSAGERVGPFPGLSCAGCMRVEKARTLFRVLINQEESLEEDMEQTLAANASRRYVLSHGYDLYILYWTAFAGDEGSISFRPDIYDWDNLLIKKLEVQQRDQALGYNSG